MNHTYSIYISLVYLHCTIDSFLDTIVALLLTLMSILAGIFLRQVLKCMGRHRFILALIYKEITISEINKY